MDALGAEGRRFESCLPDHFSNTYETENPSGREQLGNERKNATGTGQQSHGILTEREAALAAIPRSIRPFGSPDEARGDVIPGTQFMPFYYGDGKLWFVMDMETCKKVELPPPPKPHGPPLPYWLVIDRIAEAERKPHCVVYFIGTPDTAIKIGTSFSAAHRFKTLQAHSPIKLEILATRPGSEAVEGAYHDLFAAHRLHGEWFSPHPDILAEIERLSV